MRIIAGSARGRRLFSHPGQSVRPTADRVKEALFSALQSSMDLRGAKVLDLFAGSGGLGIEALSRGAAQVTFVERSPAVAQTLSRNLDHCDLHEMSRVMRESVDKALRGLAGSEQKFDLILLDPPYEGGHLDSALRNIDSFRLVSSEGMLVAEHALQYPPEKEYGSLQLTKTRRYGKTGLAFFEVES